MKKQNNNGFSTIAAALAAVAATSLTSLSVRADSPLITITPAPTPPTSARGADCGPFDPNCRDHIQEQLATPHVFPIQVEGGVTFGPAGANGAVRFSTRVLNINQTSGDLGALIFDAIYLPDNGGFRVRFTLAETEVLFMCRNHKGDAVAPVATFLSNDCRPGGAFARIGGGTTLVQIQWDAATARVAARWAEIHAVLNLLGNANHESYLHSHLQAYLGISADTVFYGDTPGAPQTGGSHTMARGNFGMTGMVRSTNNHWEIRGMAGIRPNLADIEDFSIEARTQALYHLLVSSSTVVDIGVDGQYQYNTVPSHSMGEFTSDRQRHSAYAGLVLGFNFQ